MSEVYHKRLKAPILCRELDCRTVLLQKAVKAEGTDAILISSLSEVKGGVL